jgi:hypothetical protein
MTLKERAKRIAAAAKERASNAGQDARERTANAQFNEEAVRRAKRRAGAAARRAGNAGPQGSTTPEIKQGQRSRTKEVFARAQRYATASAPVDVSMDPSPSGDKMWAFASAGNHGTPTGQTKTPDTQTESQKAQSGADSNGRWEDNPEDLDEPDEVREELRADGLDPMDVASEEEATLGHRLVHEFAGEPGMGGRSREQLDAEHDLVVAELDEDGDHDTPLEFADPFGATSGDAGWFGDPDDDSDDAEWGGDSAWL